MTKGCLIQILSTAFFLFRPEFFSGSFSTAWVVYLTISRRGYSHALPIRVCAAQRGRDFEAPDLKRGIHFRGVF